MATLYSAPYSLTYSTTVIAVVYAYNSVGWSAVSPENTSGATVQTVPVQMGQVSRGSTTSTSQIQVDWTPLTSAADTGGSSIVSYRLQWDQGTATWTDLAGFTSDYTSTTFTLTSGLASSTDYNFKVSAKNAHGWGAESAAKTIRTSAEPL